ncbi:MAG: hypothetical protein KDJ87_20360 [Rhizobiaceae bacterium]|nr:hypothetical protein [Rhizobiaceae bacterium]
MQQEETRRWSVGETVRLCDDERLMTVVRCHEDGEVSVAWFEQRKMHLERVPADTIEPVSSEAAPPSLQRKD